ncbi:MAG: hypothetical protein F4Y20_12310 [Acidobacteria bacterium]|nr:hypothetical protein [Acidobacteriota bacterium]
MRRGPVLVHPAGQPFQQAEFGQAAQTGVEGVISVRGEQRAETLPVDHRKRASCAEHEDPNRFGQGHERNSGMGRSLEINN